jgi:RNA polymerase sigma-70 factor (ECF subfamily)
VTARRRNRAAGNGFNGPEHRPAVHEYRDDPGVELMLAYQAGEECAFDRLVERYSGQVYALLTRFLGPRSGREDLVQEVFLRVIRARSTYQPAARFSTYLYRITFNLCVNRTQRSAGRESVSLDVEPAGGAGAHLHLEDERAAAPSDALERGDVVRVVREAIEALPPNQRIALILAKYEELSYADIASVLGSTEKAVKSLIHRARENLRATLAPYLSEEAV